MGVFLHGVLLLEIVEGKKLPNVDGIMGMSIGRDKSDPYVTVDIVGSISDDKDDDGGGHRVAKTRVIKDDLNPKWNEKFRNDVCHMCDYLNFKVKDEDQFSKNDYMGSMTIQGKEIMSGKPIEDWFPLVGKKSKPAGKIFVKVQFKQFRVGDVPTNDVPNTIFPPHTGCGVKLYQDAHTPPVPPVTDVIAADGKPYNPPCLWRDLSEAMENATRFIYIIGWSVKTDIPLIRGDQPDGAGDSEDLGVVLKRKAGEGVRVIIMVWDEAMSNVMNKDGVMGVHDEATRDFFKGSGVEVALTPRRKLGAKLTSQVYAGGTFTHHQKCVILDAPIEGSSKRRIISFAGGIDLTDGRYDTPAHELFKTLPVQHRRDFYNHIILKTTGKVGPREPWHDIHMYAEGPIAQDLLRNFIERWTCQVSHRSKVLLTMDDQDFDMSWTPDNVGWNCQFFRSINDDSVNFDFRDMGKLLSKKGRVYENSIQKAYIHHIRRARRFIYIENQYFIGSSQAWEDPAYVSPHLVPIELTARIISSILQGEDFRVYVVLPLHSEGDPLAAATQEILHFQHRTIQMMYRKIAKALKSKGVTDRQPTDYLCFFCLGKREGMEDLPEGYLVPPDPRTQSVATKARASLRLMIYVHSKMAIFDDEYIIIGTANINERSMSGNRDTELALGSYQPQHTKEAVGDELVRGDIHTFRRALWAEHCGKAMEEHVDPRTQQCMSTMRRLGEKNLDVFISDDPPQHNPCHLMAYPYAVTKDGKVNPWEDNLEFPDTGGSILGKNSNFLPDTLTT